MTLPSRARAPRAHHRSCECVICVPQATASSFWGGPTETGINHHRPTSQPVCPSGVQRSSSPSLPNIHLSEMTLPFMEEHEGANTTIPTDEYQNLNDNKQDIFKPVAWRATSLPVGAIGSTPGSTPGFTPGSTPGSNACISIEPHQPLPTGEAFNPRALPPMDAEDWKRCESVIGYPLIYKELLREYATLHQKEHLVVTEIKRQIYWMLYSASTRWYSYEWQRPKFSPSAVNQLRGFLMTMKQQFKTARTEIIKQFNICKDVVASMQMNPATFASFGTAFSSDLSALPTQSSLSTPSSQLSRGKKRRYSHPRESASYLVNWFDANRDWPYPNESTKEKLAKQSGLTVEQVNTWLVNHRGRHWRSKRSRSGNCPKGQAWLLSRMSPEDKDK